jgi:hypothetical protein
MTTTDTNVLLVHNVASSSWLLAAPKRSADAAAGGVPVVPFDQRHADLAQLEGSLAAVTDLIANHRHYSTSVSAVAVDPLPALHAALGAVRTAMAGNAVVMHTDEMSRSDEPPSPMREALTQNNGSSIFGYSFCSTKEVIDAHATHLVSRDDIISDNAPLAIPMFDLSNVVPFVRQLFATKAKARPARGAKKLSDANAPRMSSASGDALSISHSPRRPRAKKGSSDGPLNMLDTSMNNLSAARRSTSRSTSFSKQLSNVNTLLTPEAPAPATLPRNFEDLPKLFVVVPRAVEALFNDVTASWAAARTAHTGVVTADGGRSVLVPRWDCWSLDGILEADASLAVERLSLRFLPWDMSAEAIDGVADYVATAWKQLSHLSVGKVCTDAVRRTTGLRLAADQEHVDMRLWQSLTAAIAFRLDGAPSACATLVTLQLVGIGLQDADVDALFPDGAVRMHSLQEIDLSSNQLSGDGVMTIATRLLPSPALQTLRFAFNMVCDAGAWALRRLLRDPRCAALQLVDARMNRFSPQGVEALQSCAVPVDAPAWLRLLHSRCELRVRRRLVLVMLATRRGGAAVTAAFVQHVFPFVCMFDRPEPLRIAV